MVCMDNRIFHMAVADGTLIHIAYHHADRILVDIFKIKASFSCPDIAVLDTHVLDSGTFGHAKQTKLKHSRLVLIQSDNGMVLSVKSALKLIVEGESPFAR